MLEFKIMVEILSYRRISKTEAARLRLRGQNAGLLMGMAMTETGQCHDAASWVISDQVSPIWGGRRPATRTCGRTQNGHWEAAGCLPVPLGRAWVRCLRDKAAGMQT